MDYPYKLKDLTRGKAKDVSCGDKYMIILFCDKKSEKIASMAI